MDEKIVDIRLEEIHTEKNAQRLDLNEEAINDLTSSISRIGIQCPLVVTKDGDFFHVVFGHRRYRAAQLAGLKVVPCIVRTVDESQVKEISFAENFFRADLSAVEQASAIKDVLDIGALTIEQIAAGFHRTAYWVTRQLDLLQWPGDVLGAIHTGHISVAAGSNLALITDDVYRDFLVKNAVENGATARTTAAWLQAWRAMVPPQQAVSQEPEAGHSSPPPAVPQAPCMICSNVFRSDELSHIPVCVTCIRAVREPR